MVSSVFTSCELMEQQATRQQIEHITFVTKLETSVEYFFFFLCCILHCVFSTTATKNQNRIGYKTRSFRIHCFETIICTTISEIYACLRLHEHVCVCVYNRIKWYNNDTKNNICVMLAIHNHDIAAIPYMNISRELYWFTCTWIDSRLFTSNRLTIEMLVNRWIDVWKTILIISAHNNSVRNACDDETYQYESHEIDWHEENLFKKTIFSQNFCCIWHINSCEIHCNCRLSSI